MTDYLADTEYVSSLLDSEGLIFDNLELSAEEGTSVVAYTQADPMIMELQTLIDLSPFMNLEMVVNVAYETDNDGTMKLYYTTVAGENYQEEKSETVAVSGEVYSSRYGIYANSVRSSRSGYGQNPVSLCGWCR